MSTLKPIYWIAISIKFPKAENSELGRGITLSAFVDIIENRWNDFMDPHCVFFGVIEVVDNEAEEDPDVSVEFVFYFVFCSV